jgi:hypothetical protein
MFQTSKPTLRRGFPSERPRAVAFGISLSALFLQSLTAAPLAIVNGGFETGADNQSSLAPIAGWTDSGTSAGFWLQNGTGGGSFPQDPSGPQSGGLYLSANRLVGGAASQPASSTLSQVVPIDAANLALVQAGTAKIKLTFHYHDTDSADTGTVSVEFLDGSSGMVGSGSTGVLPDVAANGTAYDSSSNPWKSAILEKALPTATESVRIKIVTNRASGTATNVHVDSFTAEIVEIPPVEPAESPYRFSGPWVAYDGAAAPSTPAGSYFSVPFMPVSETPVAGSLKIAGTAQAAAIHYDAADAAVVGIAAEALADDIERVTGIVPAVSTNAPSAAETILIGTVGTSPLIDSLVSAGKIDVSAIQGKWEAYTAAVVENPLPGVDQALVIAGSDRRGTAFGVFALSESMGVSPWYFWGDVPTPQKAAIHVAGSHTQPSPGVKYRGIFLNDEDWGLNPWASNTFDPALGNIGPKTYATIYELLLRLHSNVIWPAMHEDPVLTTPFYQVPGNAEMADDYAIVISTSHHEPMMTNSHEYDPGVLGPYNYWTNRQAIYDFWDNRVEETAGYENIYTIGMRGRTDAGLEAPAGTTNAQKAQKIEEEIIPDQRQMISDHVNADASEMAQIFIPYKETLVQYQSGLDLPDDVTIVWPDDNHGYIRQLSNAAERARSGGSGVYYHLSYWGVPSSYLWFCTTPPGMTQSEMIKAWDYEARNIWIVNVGDIKPTEVGMEFFLRMARDPEGFRNFDQTAYFTQWAARNFDPAHSAQIAAVMDEYFRLNIIMRPEHLSHGTTGFSHVSNGDEAQRRLDEFAALTASAEVLYNQLPAAQKPAFYEMVLYPIRGSNRVNQRNLLAERSRLWATQNRAATNAVAAQAQAANTALFTEIDFYNKTNAGGKWDFMMNPDPGLGTWRRETQDPFIAPSYGSYSAPSTAGLGVVIEGSSTPLAAGTTGELPTFRRPTVPSYFIDVFNTGTSSMSWTAQASEPWITLSHTGGTSDARIMVSIDWAKMPRGHALPGTITIQGAGSTRSVKLKAFYPHSLDLGALPAAVTNNGKVTIEAEDFTSSVDAPGGTGWRRIDSATSTGDGMRVEPVTAAAIDPATLPSGNVPSLTYQFHSFGSGVANIEVRCLPTHKVTSSHAGVRYAISLNGDTPKVLDVYAIEYSGAWNANTVRAYSSGTSKHNIASPGLQTVKIWMVDPGVMLDQLIVTINSGLFEAEDLSYSTASPYHPFTEATASGGGAVSLDATAAGQFITFELPNLAVGTYDLIVRMKKGPSRGISQMSMADSTSGPFANIGSPVDLYTSVLAYSDLAAVRIAISSAGTKHLRFTVTGKNASSSNFWIVPDSFTLSAVPDAGTNSENWRAVYFGTTSNSADAADDADPDRDGIPNLIEYATGSYPTLPSPSPASAAWNGEHLALLFNRARDATDITYRVLVGDNLPPTTPIWSSESEPYPGGTAPFIQTTVTDPQEIGESQKRFLVLEVERL